MKLLQTTDDDRINITTTGSHVQVMDIVQELVEVIPTDEPVYVFDIGDVVRKHQIWIEQMPRVQPFYAVKCNDNNVVLETLAALGTGFDCASKGELSKIMSLGVSPDRVIYAQPAKPASHMRYAASVQPDMMMTFDCDVELHKIKLYCPNAK
jgi:ornithine decarboxylase